MKLTDQIPFIVFRPKVNKSIFRQIFPFLGWKILNYLPVQMNNSIKFTFNVGIFLVN